MSGNRIIETSRTALALRRVAKGAGVLLLAATLGGCALLTPPKAPPETYDISAPRKFPSLRSGTRAQVLIKEPTALKAINSQNIVVKPTPSVITYLGGAQWSDSVPKMVQVKLVETFENTGRAGAVAKPGDGLVIDYQVISAIRAFEVVVSGSTKQAVVDISVKLLNDKNGRVLRSKIFRATMPFSGSSNDDYITALDRAFDDVARDMVSWVFNRI